MEWKSTRTYAPKQAQFFKTGITLPIKDAVMEMTNNGLQAVDPGENITIKIGADGKGYSPRSKEEDDILFKMAQKTDPFGICLFENRQMPKVQREAEMKAFEERTARIKAETELEQMAKQMKNAGYIFEDGKLKKA